MSLGNEVRKSILPETPPLVDYFGPNYSYADELLLPNEIGVQRGDSLDSVINATKGVLWYTDMIGYGEASSVMTKNMAKPPFAMGVNYFVRTSTKCSHGADAWMYMPGIPQGDALGSRIQEALDKTGLPKLRGLAPGIIEDAKSALDPRPVLNAVFGSGYARCRQETKPVGDYKGSLQGKDGSQWVRPLYPNDIQYLGGRPHQTRWVVDSNIDYQTWKKEYDRRIFCADGTRIAAHANKDCSKPLVEGFTNPSRIPESSLATVLLLGTIIAVWMRVYAKA